MDSKESISELIERIKKATNLTQEQIADRIGYERPYLSQAKKIGSEKLRKVLLNNFKEELENLTLNKYKDNKDVLIESLQIQNLSLRLEKIETNLNEMLSNQAALVVLIKEAVKRAAIYRYSAQPKKLEQELAEINKIVGASLK